MAVRTYVEPVYFTRIQPTRVHQYLDSTSDSRRAELLKVLTPAQREVLERLSGIKLEGK